MVTYYIKIPPDNNWPRHEVFGRRPYKARTADAINKTYENDKGLIRCAGANSRLTKAPPDVPMPCPGAASMPKLIWSARFSMIWLSPRRTFGHQVLDRGRRSEIYAVALASGAGGRLTRDWDPTTSYASWRTRIISLRAISVLSPLSELDRWRTRQFPASCDFEGRLSGDK